MGKNLREPIDRFACLQADLVNMAYNINPVNYEDYVTRRWFLKVSYACLSTLEKRVMDMVVHVSKGYTLYPTDEQKIIKLPKLKEIKIRGYRKLERTDDRIINATIYKESDKYYVNMV